MKNIFAPQTRKSDLDGLLQGLRQQAATTGSNQFTDNATSASVLSLESADSTVYGKVQTAASKLHASLESIAAEYHGLASGNFHAGTCAGLMAANVGHHLHAKPGVYQPSKNSKFIPATGSVDRMREALEAYDEKENRDAAIYSVAYNMQAARQDEFGEALFPTVVVANQVGFTISMHLVRVMNDIRHQTTGVAQDFGFQNIVHAVRDPSILNNDSTNIVPVVRSGVNDTLFVSSSDVTPTTVSVGTEQVSTAPLKFNTQLDLLGVSQTDGLINSGLMDPTDSIDTAITLDAIYLKVTNGSSTEVYKFITKQSPTATFNYSVQDNFRQMVLNYNSNSLMLSPTSVTAAKTAPSVLATVVSGNWVVKLSITASGTVNLQTGQTQLLVGTPSVVTITGSDDVEHVPTDSAVSAVAALFAGATVIGYDLGARRTNMNRRQRGQMLDTTVYNQTYAVPLLAPITIPRPMGQGDGTDSSDLAALITATRIRTSNAAVQALLDAAQTLQAYVSGREGVADTTDIMGVSRYIINPVFRYTSLPMNTIVQTLTSAERAADIQAALVSALRDVAYNMYRDSGYKPAADALNGGEAEAPTVIIATDPVIARYLTVTGDLRTLGNDFKVKIVSTNNIKMTGKIFMTFGQFGAGTEGSPNPLHFGNMGWKPEMTLVLPLTRNGAFSKELTVQPSFLHVVNLPILAEFDVTGISTLVDQAVVYQVTHA